MSTISLILSYLPQIVISLRAKKKNKKKPGWLNLHEQRHLNQKDDSEFAVQSF